MTKQGQTVEVDRAFWEGRKSGLSMVTRSFYGKFQDNVVKKQMPMSSDAAIAIVIFLSGFGNGIQPVSKPACPHILTNAEHLNP